MNGPLAYPRVPQKPPLPPRPRQPSMQHCLVHTEIAMPGIGGQARKFIVAHVDQRFVIPRFEIDVRLTIDVIIRSEEHTSELQSLMRISYAVFCLKKKKKIQ